MTPELHLSEHDVEALAGGRHELVDAAFQQHAEACESCRNQVRLARILAGSVTSMLGATDAPVINFEAMIARAMAARPVGFDLKDRANQVLLGVVTLVTVCSGIASAGRLSLPRVDSVTGVLLKVNHVVGSVGGASVAATVGFAMLLAIVAAGVWVERSLHRVGVK